MFSDPADAEKFRVRLAARCLIPPPAGVANAGTSCGAEKRL
jgi:hypothetical protein